VILDQPANDKNQRPIIKEVLELEKSVSSTSVVVLGLSLIYFGFFTGRIKVFQEIHDK
jgi:hypothetical protein